MAKKKKGDHKADKTEAPPAKAEKKAEKAEKAEKLDVTPVERAFAAGNYSDVRSLAASDTSERAKQLLALTRLDMGQVAVGLFAIAVVLTVAIMTLK